MPRLKTYKLTYFKSGRNGGTAVPTPELAGLVRPLLLRFGKALDPAHNSQNGDWNGALIVVAERVAASYATIRPLTAEACYRRISGVLAIDTEMTDLGMADSILNALGCNLESDTDLPVFPTNLKAAKELVEIHYPELSPTEKKELSRKLDRFSLGYGNSGRIFGDKDALARAAKSRKQIRQRHQREFRNGKRAAPRNIIRRTSVVHKSAVPS